jgi:hypothetical protein
MGFTGATALGGCGQTVPVEATHASAAAQPSRKIFEAGRRSTVIQEVPTTISPGGKAIGSPRQSDREAKSPSTIFGIDGEL